MWLFYLEAIVFISNEMMAIICSLLCDILFTE